MKKALKILNERKDKFVDKNSSFVRGNKSFVGNVFRVSFILLLIIHCVENTSVIYSDAVWVEWMYMFRNILYLVLLIKAGFLSTYERKEFTYVIVILVIGFMSLLGSGSFGLFELIIVIIAAKDETPDELITVFAKIKGLAIVVTLLLWSVGVLEAIYYLDDAVGYYNTYGFCHRNVLGANVTVVCLAWFYLRYRKLIVRDVVGWSILAIATYCLSVSRTSFMIMLLIIFSFYFFQEKEKYLIEMPSLHSNVLKGFLALLLLTIIGTLFYDKSNVIWNMIDSIFTKRFYFANYCYEEYGLSLFGQQLPFVSSIQQQTEDISKLILDNSYMRSILYYGIIPGGILLCVCFKSIDIAFLKMDYAWMLALAVFAVYGMSESYMIDIFYNFPLLIAWGHYFNKEDIIRVPCNETPLWFVNAKMIYANSDVDRRKKE